MFEQVLPRDTKTVLALLEKSEIIQKAYLAGGTALALQLGHRVSYDLDFFTQEEFDERMLLPEIEGISKFQLEKIAWRTIIGKFEDVKLGWSVKFHVSRADPKRGCCETPDFLSEKGVRE